jgi:hypothetical protein
MDNWRPTGKVEGNHTGYWGAISFPSVSIKDRSLLVPLVMLNAGLTFSWPNKVPFDHEASDTVRAGIYTGTRIGAARGMRGTRKVSPRCVLAVGRSLGTTTPICPATFTWEVSLVICSSLDRWVWFMWGINHQLVRNRFESPSLLNNEHLTWVTHCSNDDGTWMVMRIMW